MGREFEELAVALAGWEHAEKIGVEPNSPPHADPLGLHDALEEEIADVLILLATLAHGVHVDLTRAVQAKFAILQTRQYGKPDAQGIVEHIREGQDGVSENDGDDDSAADVHGDGYGAEEGGEETERAVGTVRSD